jgi:hypothetical protein
MIADSHNLYLTFDIDRSKTTILYNILPGQKDHIIPYNIFRICLRFLSIKLFWTNYEKTKIQNNKLYKG